MKPKNAVLDKYEEVLNVRKIWKLHFSFLNYSCYVWIALTKFAEYK
jgi:hypothetical protein